MTPDRGKNSIADIIVFEGIPDPNQIVNMFASIAGMHDMLFVLLCGLVLWRYRSLIPLMFAFMIVESGFGFVVGALHPLDPMYFDRVPPGKVASLPEFVLGIVMLSLAVRNAIIARTLHDTG